MLVSNQLAANPEFLDVSKAAVGSFAGNMIRNEAELIFAVNSNAEIEMKTGEIELLPDEKESLKKLIAESQTGWNVLFLGGIERVCHIVYFEPYDWYILVTEHRAVFYQAVNQIYIQTGFILSLSLLISLLLLIIFANRITMPLRKIVIAMRNIISSNDLSRKVDLLYHDETGELGHTFNIMTEELEKAYDQIKIYALETAIAQKKEQKIRNIFQKYVPKDVIDRYFREPEALLEGEERVLAILFSDIRGFTTISEGMRPSEIVGSLNSYFSSMVDIIMEHNGIVDKYIGDAIMAFFGAPVRHKEDAYLALQTAFEMMKAVSFFNKVQISRNSPEFKIGIGINYGIVTVGNIGSDKKMDYTVIGDMVNLASRIEGLTKVYREPIVFSETVYQQASLHVPCRMIDKVAVKGKDTSIRVYTARESLTAGEQEAWEIYHNGLNHYYNRDFEAAIGQFKLVQDILPGDYLSGLFLERGRSLLKTPPAEDWNGEIHMLEK